MSEASAELRVLHVFRILDREIIGGLYTYLESLADAARLVSVRTEVCAVFHGSKPECVESCAYAEPKPGNRVFAALRFRAWLKTHVHEYDVVHIHGVDWALLCAGDICKSAAVPYVVSPHASLMHWRRRQVQRHWRVYRQLFAKPLLRLAKAIVCTTGLDERENLEFEPQLRTVKIPPGYDVPAELPSRQLNADVLNIVFVSRVQPLKGLPDTLKAIALLRAQDIAVRLHVLGTGPDQYVAELKDQIQSLGISDSIIWHGYVIGEAKDKICQQSDVFVLNSQGENYSFATAEALAFGIPVVLSRGVGLAELVSEHGGGRVVPINSPADLAESLRQYTDKSRSESEGKLAFELAQSHLSHQAMGAALRECYAHAIGDS